MGLAASLVLGDPFVRGARRPIPDAVSLREAALDQVSQPSPKTIPDNAHAPEPGIPQEIFGPRVGQISELCTWVRLQQPENLDQALFAIDLPQRVFVLREEEVAPTR
jgi:hypothetical protein